MADGFGRRSFLRAAGALGLLALVPPRRLQALVASAPGPAESGRFLDAHELAHLDERSQQAVGVDFKDAPGPAQDLLLSDQTDGDLQTFVGAALANTLEAMYGPPEYGGNRSLAGWGYTRWQGDLQPRGST